MSTNDNRKLTKSQLKKIKKFIEAAQKIPVISGRIEEVRDYHPIVREWLTQNDYEYQHHVKLEDYGVADFIATHKKDGTKLLIEAKCLKTDIRKAILQVRVYQIQVPDAEAVIIAPPDVIKSADIKAAEKYGIKVITVDIPDEIKNRKDTKTLFVYHCPDCDTYSYFPKGENMLVSVNMDILKEEGTCIIVREMEPHKER